MTSMLTKSLWAVGMVFAIALLLFAPIFVIHLYSVDQVPIGHHEASEITVGIAVILRATARRLLRTGARNILRTTFGTFSRATARAMTRRFVRIAAHSMTGAYVRQVAGVDNPDDLADEGVEPKWWSSPLGLGLGFVALTLSFWGVLWVSTVAVREDVLTAGGGISLPIASLLAGVPILVYAGMLLAAARYWQVKLRFSTAIDGLFLQAYFTGAGSFLPMTTDTEYEGHKHDQAKVAVVGLAGLYFGHLVCEFLSGGGDNTAQFMSAVFLIYCFVYSFPIAPLEGHLIWKRSKLLWCLLWIPILFSFLKQLPIAFNEIL